MSEPASGRAFIIKLRPLPGVDAIKALRRGLKHLLRYCGLRCTEVREEKHERQKQTRT
jgi:hypothetical protein